MASQKNQHFVPKVHLTPFSSNGDGKFISLYNIRSQRVIHRAAIKHQCAGSYFYGDDKILENYFGQIEGQYARIVRAIKAGQISDADVEWMQMFMVLQYARTQAAVDHQKEFLERAAAVTLHGKTIQEDEKPDLSHSALVHGALRQFKWMVRYTRDLEFCVFRNCTKYEFVTSDNPLIFTNRFYAQKLRADNWGAASAGALLILPLDPRYSSCLYDSGMYSVDKRHGFVDVRKPTDILVLNEMQYLHAHQNIYFSEPDTEQRVVSEFGAVSGNRIDERVRLLEFAAIEIKPGIVKYERIEPGKEGDHIKQKLIMYQTPRPLLSRWPSVLPFRFFRRQAYSNGTAVGWVRKREWLKGSPRSE